MILKEIGSAVNLSNIQSLPLAELQKKSSQKWRKYDKHILPMHIAEMDFDIALEIKTEIVDRVQRGDLGYLGPIPELGDAVSKFAFNRWGWNLDPNLVTPAVDVGVAAIEVIRVLANSGDQVLINSPAYSNFFNWLDELKMQLVDVPMLQSAQGWELDFVGIEDAFKSGIKIYLLCNPQNPVGHVHAENELRAVAELANKYQVFVISDEIHAPLTYSDISFTPYLKIPEASETGYAITSASKAWNISGLKAAVIVSGSEKAANRIAALPKAVHMRTSIVGAFAMIAAMNSATAWLDETLDILNHRRFLLQELLLDLAPGVQYKIPSAGYLAWLDLTSFGENDNWHDHFVNEGKVSIVPGQEFGHQYKNFIRLNFATYPEILEEGVRRISKALS